MMKKFLPFVLLLSFIILLSGCSSSEVSEEENFTKPGGENNTQTGLEENETIIVEVCGDANCSVSESCSSCPSDCGACPAVSLNISHNTAGGCRLCYLGCLTMMLSHYEGNISVDDAFIYSSVSTEFYDVQASESIEEPEGEEEEEVESGENASGLGYDLIISTARNLGYTPKIAYSTPIKGVFNNFYHKITSEEDKVMKSNKRELLNFTKRVLSAGNPVMTWWDNSTVWKEEFGVEWSIEPLVIRGYNESSLFIQFASSDPVVINESIPDETFLNGWSETVTNPFIIYVNNTGERMNKGELLNELRTNAGIAVSNLRSCANSLENRTRTLSYSDDFGTLSFRLEQYACLRQTLASFLEDEGLTEAAGLYENSSVKFEEVSNLAENAETSDEVPNVLREIADLEDEAYNFWS